MLRQSLKSLGLDPVPLLEKAGIDPTARAEDIPVEGFVALASAFTQDLPGLTHDMIRQSMTAYRAPLCETIVEAPEPRGTEVLVRISRCGVCHSDSICRMAISASAATRSSTSRAAARSLHARPRDRGRGGESRPRRQRARPAARSRCFPGSAAANARPARGEENLCAAPRHLGIQVDGGFATHVLVPHPRYLIDHTALPACARRRLHVLGPDRVFGA